MRFFRTLLLFIVMPGVHAQGISFIEGSFSDLKTKARAENRLIFIDAYTTWCGPCKAMAKTVFPDSIAGSFFNRHFISAKIDMEKGEGPQLGDRYSVSCYPTFLFLDSSGALIHKFSGMMDAAMFVSFSNNALVTGKGFGAMERRYAAGDRDPVFVADYIRACGFACMSTNRVALSYLMSMHENALLEEQNWNIFRENVDDVRSMPFTYLVNNRDAFVSKFGEEQVDEKIFDAYINYASILLRDDHPDKDSLALFASELTSLNFGRSEELRLTFDLAAAERFSKWDEYFSTGKILVEKYRSKDHDFLNSISYTLFEHTDNRQMLEQGLRWAKMSVEIKEEAYNLDTYASLLWKNGKKAEAEKVQARAIAVAGANGEDTSQLEETLRKIRGSKG